MNKNTKCLILASAVLLFGSTSFAGQKEDLCNIYADNGVRQSNLDTKWKCGFSNTDPARWSGNRQAHYNWCMMLGNNNIVNKAEADRWADLKNCAQTNKKDFCIDYALTAVEQNQQATQWQCGFSNADPARWNNNHQAHNNWCMNSGASVEDIFKASERRRHELDHNCKQNICDKYASTAVNQNQQAIQLNCGFSGPRWNSDYNTHHTWCSTGNNSKKAIYDETTARNNDLKSCGKQAKQEDKDKLLAAIGGFLFGLMTNQNSTPPSNGPGPGPGLGNDHISWCYNAYDTYRVSDNTYKPINGPRRQCMSPYN